MVNSPGTPSDQAKRQCTRNLSGTPKTGKNQGVNRHQPTAEN
nr:MAG TPA: hypothetical protein [Caudoviricetes sp.]